MSEPAVQGSSEAVKQPIGVPVDERDVFQHATLTPARWSALIVGLVLLGAGIVVGCLGFGAQPIGILDTVRMLFAAVRGGAEHSDLAGTSAAILLHVRLPRVLTGFAVGAALGTVGATLQALVRNPLADPYILGISSGAALGACLAVLGGVSVTGLGVPVVTLCAFAGAVVAILLVYRIAAAGGRLPMTTLLLAGVILNAIFSALIMFATSLMSPARSFGMLAWLMGSLTGPDGLGLLLLAAWIALGMLMLFREAGTLNVLSLGEEPARALGVDVDGVKTRLFVTTALLTGAVVSVSGLIGFVGMAVPHVVRLLFGADHRLVLPASACVGGMLLVAADTVARTALSPDEFPVGVITALLGGPFFMYLLVRRKGAGMGAAL